MVKIIKYKKCEINSMINKKNIAVISALSGIFSAIPYIFKDFSFIIFITISPALYCTINYKKHAFISMFFYFFSFYFFSDIWMLSIGINFISNKIYGFTLSCIIIIAVSLLLAFTAALPFSLIKIIKDNKPIIIFIVLPFIYIFGEWFHGIYPLNFPWNRLCNIVSYDIDFIQTASILGGLFISYVIVLINLCLVYSIKLFSEHKLKTLIYVASAILIFKSNIFAGEIVNYYYNFPNKDLQKVMIVQGNFSRNEKQNIPVERMLDEYINLSKKNLTNDTKLIIFPETSVSSIFFNDENYKNKLFDFVKSTNTCLLFGVTYNLEDEKYNSCAVIYPDKTISEIYMKRKLVPFGEYTPSIFPKNIQFIKTTYSCGKKNTIINSNIGKIGCTICYESIFPSLAADNIQLNAQILAVLTNDSWLGNFVPLYQHHGNSILRAVENRKYTITCANTGISSVISPNGTIITSSLPNVRETITANVCGNDIKTFYSKNGDIIIIPSFVIIFILIVLYAKYKINGNTCIFK